VEKKIEGTENSIAVLYRMAEMVEEPLDLSCGNWVEWVALKESGLFLAFLIDMKFKNNASATSSRAASTDWHRGVNAAIDAIVANVDEEFGTKVDPDGGSDGKDVPYE
jgi:hypothetical protein